MHLDARRPGVRLPPRFLSEAHLRLDYGYGFAPPIPDLEIGDDGISATLSFSRVPFPTFIPWTAVYLIADFDGSGAIWQEDIPSDLKLTAPPDGAEGAPGLKTPPPEDKPPEPPKKPRPSHLKLVK
ncbi:MAG: Stringent starvation protein [Myxococcales bacterium]|nr:Stringent starvation protein [Myxococcales bacterium]